MFLPAIIADSGKKGTVGAGRDWSLLLLAALVVTAGCYDRMLVPDVETEGEVTVTNDEDLLNERVQYTDTDVPIISSSLANAGPAAGAPPVLAPSAIRLTLIAEILPPTVGGVVLQATSVWATDSDKSMVSYNVRGGTRRGAVDHFTRLLNGGPRLRSSVSFGDADVSSVIQEGNWAVMAMATDDVSFTWPAIVQRIEVRNDTFRLGGTERTALTSFAGTSVLGTGSEVYATSGDGGEVFAFDRDDFSALGQFPLDDARWVAYDNDNERIAVLQGNPGRLAVFDRGVFPMTLLNTFFFPGADVPEAKSTVEVVEGKAFVAAGPDGVQVVCLDNGQIVGSVPRPDPASLGLDPSVVQTNSVTVFNDLMFISNGEAGVYAAAADQDFDQTACDEPVNITVLGRLQFANLQSANHVVYRDDRLFVAAGLGGIKVVDVQVYEQPPAPVDLGTAIDFVILSKSGITNNSTSVITGNIGTSPITGAAIVGLDCPQVSGSMYTVSAASPTSLGAGTCRIVDAPKLTLAVLERSGQ
jgi:hypothetical protein